MEQLKATISRGLWRALVDHAERTREPLAHIVSKALAEYLQVSHHTLYQVSTATALVEGIYQGAVRIGTLREHGDLGLGTFENLDGEMVIVDGQVFQVRSDGSVRECDDDALCPGGDGHVSAVPGSEPSNLPVRRAVALVTSGPGCSNLVTGLATANA